MKTIFCKGGFHLALNIFLTVPFCLVYLCLYHLYWCINDILQLFEKKCPPHYHISYRNITLERKVQTVLKCRQIRGHSFKWVHVSNSLREIPSKMYIVGEEFYFNSLYSISTSSTFVLRLVFDSINIANIQILSHLFAFLCT